MASGSRTRRVMRLTPVLVLSATVIAACLTIGYHAARDLTSVAAHVPQLNPAIPDLQSAFPEAPAAELTEDGLQLFSPTAADRATLTVTQAQAETRATGSRGDGTTVRRSILVRMNYAPNTRFDCVCWAVSVIPPGGVAVPHRPAPAPGTAPSPVPPYVYRYSIVFVSAATGVIDMTVERGDQA